MSGTCVLESNEGKRFFCKQAYATNFNSSSIAAELHGLDELRKAGLRIPEIYTSGQCQKLSYFISQFVQAENSTIPAQLDLAKQLQKLHMTKASRFGYYSSNYIGTLHQQNEWSEGFMTFYVQSRIGPQFALARKNGFLLDLDIDPYYKQVEQFMPSETPALIHGDLWNGNVIFSKDLAYFIDPSVAYSHREFDLAMMSLFGGFSSNTYKQYNELFPLAEGWKERKGIFQLYFLLVHVNMFGSSYEASVKEIVKQYL